MPHTFPLYGDSETRPVIIFIEDMIDAFVGDNYGINAPSYDTGLPITMPPAACVILVRTMAKG